MTTKTANFVKNTTAPSEAVRKAIAEATRKVDDLRAAVANVN